MARKKTKTTAARKRQNEEARESFIPGETDPKPVQPKIEADVAAEHKAIPDTTVELKITEIEARRLAVSLTVSPLEVCVEKVFLPIKASPEQLASIVSAAIKRAAGMAENDGMYQHAERQREDAEAKERFAARA